MGGLNRPSYLGLFYLAKLVRGGAWWYAKIPPLTAIIYALLLIRPPQAGAAFAILLGILWSLGSLFSFGYVVNDVFDIVEDQRVGKLNAMAQKRPWQRAFLCSLFFAAGFLPWLWINFGRFAAVLLLVNYGLPMAYSIPPLRLKERGLLGIVADAIMVHALPTLFVSLCVCRLVAGFGRTSLQLTIMATAWALFFGLRGILIHQIQEHENDSRAGLRTMAVRSGPDCLRRIGRVCFFFLEVPSQIVLAVMIFPFAPAVLFVLILYAVFDIARHKTWRMSFDPVPTARGTYITLADFNEVWLPLSIAVSLGVRKAPFLVLLVFHFGLFYGDIKKRICEVVALVSEKKKRLRTGRT